jgi:hypothetical protein
MAPKEPKNKRRKIDEENRTYQEEWEVKFAFQEKGNNPLCLICQTVLAHNKKESVKRHYETNHQKFSSDFPLHSEVRKIKIQSLKSHLSGQQTLLSSFRKEADIATEASFLIAWNIARSKHPYSDGEFVKKNISEVLSLLDPSNSKLNKLVSQISISRHTTERRISQISADVESNLKKDLQNCKAFSLALDESTDIQDNPQLAVFVRLITSDDNVKEELLGLVALKETTRGVDVKKALDDILNEAGVPKEKLVSVATDGAPAMVGKNLGLVGLIRSDPSYPDFLPIHCIIHREHLTAKHFNFENVMKTVLEIVNFIRSNAKTHRQFKIFIAELELEDKPSDLSFFCLVRWLSSSNVLNRFVELLDPIICFLKEKKKSFPILENGEWLMNLMFLTDVLNHLQTLNLSLQGKDKIVSDLAQTIFSFQKKIQLFQKDIMAQTFNHFPNLRKLVNSNSEIQVKSQKMEDYRSKLQGLLEDFQSRFQDLQKLKSCFEFLVNPFLVDVIDSGCPFPSNMVKDLSNAEMELLEIQEDINLKMLHKSLLPVEFWKLLPEQKYPELKQVGQRLLSIFGSTYNCEAMFSTMKFIKSKHRANLTNQHLSELLRTSSTCFKPDFKKLSNSIQIHRVC